MSALAAIQAINDSLAVAAAITQAMKVAQMAGREVTMEEVEAAKNSLMASEVELKEAIDEGIASEAKTAG